MDLRNNMNAKRLSAILAIISTVGLFILPGGCRYHPPRPNFCDLINDLPLTPVSGDPPATVFEDPGTIKVMHGSGFAHIDSKPAIKVEQAVEIPGYANQATVFLNGWKLNYGKDHHVAGVATAIGKIKLEKTKLTWNAAGILADDGFDKSIDWRYFFTVVAWNDASLHAFVDQGDADFFCKSGGSASASDNFFFAKNSGTSTALSSFPTLLQKGIFSSSRSIAVLPRGFGFEWGGGDDHHLRQVAYNLEHSETFAQHQAYKKAEDEIDPLSSPPPTGRVGSGFVSWNSDAIFKDDDDRRDYKFGELVSAMGGDDVSVIQPPFSILPHESHGFFSACLGEPAGEKTEEFVVDNIPYAYAIPMLTGWDLVYGCDDHHVRQIGVSIDDLNYDKPANASTGTLRYKLSSILADDSNHGHGYRHKVSILCLRALPPSRKEPPILTSPPRRQ
jgi:hypothetical protein